MSKHIDCLEGFSLQKLPLSKDLAMYYFSACGNSKEALDSHLGIINSISGMRIAGPEIYASFEINSHLGTSAGGFNFLGTQLGIEAYRGLQCCLIPKSISRDIIFKGKKVGVYFEDDFASYALLGGICPDDKTADAYSQTTQVFENIEGALAEVKMDFSNIARTWFYNDKILDWYGDFNRARDSFFNSRKVFGGIVPASTGIGSGNCLNSALVARAFAFKTKGGMLNLREVESPMQCSAMDYKSSFSRAVELEHPLFKHLIVSGTAGIEYGGKTAFVGDLKRQINLALDVIEAILKSRGMAWENSLRAVAYLKDFSFFKDFEEIKKMRGLDALPCVAIQADVCRDDLLFEMELDAAIVKHS